jgi:hypothetical protein
LGIDLETSPISCSTLAWFARQGVPAAMLAVMTGLRVAFGTRSRRGLFEPDPEGRLFLTFYEPRPDDFVFWSPSTGELATLLGRAFALGEEQIRAATTYDFGGALSIHIDPLEWLRSGAHGVVVIDWRRAFDMLRDADRIQLPEALLSTYRRAMQPRLPKVTVVKPAIARAAA